MKFKEFIKEELSQDEQSFFDFIITNFTKNPSKVDKNFAKSLCYAAMQGKFDRAKAVKDAQSVIEYHSVDYIEDHNLVSTQELLKKNTLVALAGELVDEYISRIKTNKNVLWHPPEYTQTDLEACAWTKKEIASIPKQQDIFDILEKYMDSYPLNQIGIQMRTIVQNVEIKLQMPSSGKNGVFDLDKFVHSSFFMSMQNELEKLAGHSYSVSIDFPDEDVVIYIEKE